MCQVNLRGMCVHPHLAISISASHTPKKKKSPVHDDFSALILFDKMLSTYKIPIRRSRQTIICLALMKIYNPM